MITFYMVGKEEEEEDDSIYIYINIYIGRKEGDGKESGGNVSSSSITFPSTI